MFINHVKVFLIKLQRAARYPFIGTLLPTGLFACIVIASQIVVKDHFPDYTNRISDLRHGIPVETAGIGQHDLIQLKKRLMEANYTGNLEELSDLAAEFGTYKDDPGYGWIASYHAGFAQFVIALMVGPNGLVSRMGDYKQMIEHVDKAIDHLEASVAKPGATAESYALLSHLYAMKLRSDPQNLGATLGSKSQKMLARARELAPDNPRALLIGAMKLFWAPPASGGDRTKGIMQWERAIELFERETERENSVLPDWGHAEALAWIPAAYLAMQPPRTKEAAQAARKALEIRPDYKWLQVSVLPSVETVSNKDR